MVYFFVKASRQRPSVTEDTNNNVCEQRGLDDLSLQAIRVIQFDPKSFKEGLECAVCLSEVKEGEKIRILPKCDHGFHMECVDMWFQSHTTCPVCRNHIIDHQSEISVELQDSTIVLLEGDEADNQSRSRE